MESLNLHHCIVSIMEEMEHAAMCLEWMRRNSKEFDGHLREFLFTEDEIADH